MRLGRASWAGTVLLTALLGAGCTGSGDSIPEQILDDPARQPFTATPRPYLPPSGLALGRNRQAPAAATIIRGAELPREPPAAGLGQGAAGDGGYVLNFESVEIRDVVKAVLADMLGLAYVIDPAVQGTLTLHTARSLPREAVLPAFEEALKLSGVALVAGTAGYQVLPLQGAARVAPVGRGGAGAGYRVVLVPLRYAAAADIQRVLEPIVPAGTVAQADPQRNVLMLAGTEADVSRAQRTINLFDVDWLRSQSYGLFPLQYTPAKTVATDLESVVGGKGPLAGHVRVTAIEHLNAILVAAPRLADVTATRSWIERFDRGRDQTTPRLFVYRVQNGRAQDLARTLTAALGRPGSGTPSSPSQGPDDAPQLPEGLGSPAPATRLRTAGGGGGGLAAAPGPIPSVLLGNMPGADNTGQTGSPSDMRISADESNNALLIVTTPERYQQVEAALAQLDIVPLQVMLEASIAEVNLTNQLRYGIQYYFRSGNFSALASGVAAAGLGTSTGGLSLAILNGADIGAILDLLSSITRIRVISAPKLVVLNNRTASLQVGDQVPIATASAVGVVTNNAPIVNTIQLLDTGIILRVTPRVNQSGLVLLDLAQEVSASVPTNTSSINSPTIQQRRVATSVAVQDGQTIAIGGLIRDSRNRSRSGIPLLKDIPGLGFLFGQTSDQLDRTELIVLITPHVIRDARGADAATDELRAKLPLVRAFNAAAPR